MLTSYLAFFGLSYAQNLGTGVRSLRIWFAGENWSEAVDDNTVGCHLETAALGYTHDHVKEAIKQALQRKGILALCACGCGKLCLGGLMEAAHPGDYCGER